MWLVYCLSLYKTFDVLIICFLSLFLTPTLYLRVAGAFTAFFICFHCVRLSSLSYFQCNRHVEMFERHVDVTSLTQMQFDACIPLCVCWITYRWTVYAIHQIDSCKVLPNNGRMTCMRARSTITINYWKHKKQQQQEPILFSPTFFSSYIAKGKWQIRYGKCQRCANQHPIYAHSLYYAFDFHMVYATMQTINNMQALLANQIVSFVKHHEPFQIQQTYWDPLWLTFSQRHTGVHLHRILYIRSRVYMFTGRQIHILYKDWMHIPATQCQCLQQFISVAHVLVGFLCWFFFEHLLNNPTCLLNSIGSGTLYIQVLCLNAAFFCVFPEKLFWWTQKNVPSFDGMILITITTSDAIAAVFTEFEFWNERIECILIWGKTKCGRILFVTTLERLSDLHSGWFHCESLNRITFLIIICLING